MMYTKSNTKKEYKIVVEFTTTSEKEKNEMMDTIKKYGDHPIIGKKFPKGKFRVISKKPVDIDSMDD